MFCTNCGSPAADDAKFCGNCGSDPRTGKKPNGVSSIPTGLKQTTKRSSGHLVSAPGAIAALVAFFLPWIVVSCQFQKPISYSGYELASGSKGGLPINELYVLIIGAVVALVVAYYAHKRGYATQADGWVLIGSGVLPLFVLFQQYTKLQNQYAQYGVTIDVQVGLFATIGGFALVIFGGWICSKRE